MRESWDLWIFDYLMWYNELMQMKFFVLALAGILFFGISAVAARAQAIQDGDLIKTANSFDIFIVKIKNSKKFKRLILNPAIFNSYGHLKWENVKTVSQTELDNYKLSEFVIEVNPDGSVKDPKVYRVRSAEDSDIGERSWLNITAAEFEALGYDWDSIYFINSTEASPNFYPTKDSLTYAKFLDEKIFPGQTFEKPAAPAKDTAAPQVSGISASKILADSVVIIWTTDEMADSRVKYGTSEGTLVFSATGTAIQAAGGTFAHTVSLGGLAENTKYYYQAVSTDEAGNASQIITNSFTTSDCYGDVPAAHKTIQAAIDAVSKDGAKICLGSGTFKENIVIDGKNLKIVGQGPDKTIISAATSSAVVIFKNAGTSGSLEQLKIQNGATFAVLIEDASPVIKNNHIKNNFAGVRLLGNSRPDILYNVFDGNNSGPAVAHNSNLGDYKIDHNTFMNNGLTGSAATILLDSIFPSSAINITSNILSNGYIGVYEKAQSNYYLWNNLFYNNSYVNVERQNSFYFSQGAINELGFAAKNIVSDPLLDSLYKPKINSPAIGAGAELTNIGAY